MKLLITRQMYCCPCRVTLLNGYVQVRGCSGHEVHSLFSKNFSFFGRAKRSVASGHFQNFGERFYLVGRFRQQCGKIFGERRQWNKVFNCPKFDALHIRQTSEYRTRASVNLGVDLERPSDLSKRATCMSKLKHKTSSMKSRSGYLIAMAPPTLACRKPDGSDQRTYGAQCTRPCAFISRLQCRPNPDRVCKKNEQSGNKCKSNYFTGVLVSEFPHELPFQKEMLA